MRRLIAILAATLAIGVASPVALAFEVHRGVGLHEWLNWSPLEADGSYRWPPYRSVGEWLGRYRPLADWPQTDPFADIGVLGLDFVRLTVDPGPLLASSGEKRDEAIAVIRDAAGRLTAAGLSVVVNLHSVDQVPEYGMAALTAGPDSASVANYIGAAAALSRALLPLGTDKVAIEPFNEPSFYPCDAASAAAWNRVMAAQVEAIRDVSREITIVATGACSGGIDGLKNLVPDFDDPHVLYSFHMYEPHVFTHQFAPTKGDFASGLPWPSAGGSADAVMTELRAAMSAAGVPAADQDRQANVVLPAVTQYFAEGWDAARLTARIGEALAWARQHDIPPARLFMGEFGVMLQSPDRRSGAPMADRSRWIRAVRELAEANGFAWSVWEYANPWGMSVIQPDGPAVPDRDLLVALGLAQ